MRLSPRLAMNTGPQGSNAGQDSCQPLFQLLICQAKPGNPLFRSGKSKAVQIARRLGRDQLVGEIGFDHRTVPRAGIADATAAGRQDDHTIAGGDQVLALAGQLLAGPEADHACGSVSSAADAASGVIDAFIRGVVEKPFVDAVFHLDVLARAAAVLALFLAPADDGRHRFEYLDRATAYAAGKSCRRQAVAERQRAHAAGSRNLHLKAGVELRRAGPGTEDRDAPQGAGALRRHAIRNRLPQTAEYQIRQHQADLAA